MATAGRRVAIVGCGYSHVGRNTGLSIDDHMIAATKAALADAGLTVKDIDGITSVGTAGHSAGHTSHVIASGSSRLFLQGDVSHVPYLFVRNPGWHVMFDHDPVAAEATRRRVYDMLVAEKMLVQGFHYPFPSLAYVEKSGSGYREAPVAWNPTL